MPPETSRLIFSAMLPMTTSASTPMVMPKMVSSTLSFRRKTFLRDLHSFAPVVVGP